ncbi:hypothetical protein QQ008_07185 [Fulvivirgaceae bacterium BMA10]|uniref:Lipoprotein n=1 Tax=Splendidivirga corallicola TaxID=3051826 RepID=A0ABT8KM84_9BACT|nr:hypothetical protein [Fulvivirgaceae bacterium BMA10]
MKQKFLAVAFFLAITLVSTVGCSQHTKSGEAKNKKEARGEHARDEGGEGEGEEDGTELGLNEVYDQVKRGTRMILKYDKSSNSFIGTVKNIGNKNLEKVRVEVHLSNGKELGPTTPVNLSPGETKKIVLKATSRNFKGWTTHAEVGGEEGEHGKEGEHGEGGERHEGREGEHN